MRIARQRPRCGPVWAPRLLALAALTVLGGCGIQGDFGEISPSATRADMHDWIAGAAIGKVAQTSNFPLTEDERALRDLAYPLIEPPYDRQRFYSVAGEYGLFGAGNDAPFDSSRYAWHLSERGRSATSRYQILTDDIRNDATRLPHFFETAGRVLDMDAKRRKSLFYVDSLTPGEEENAARRIKENAAIVALVRRSLDQRVASYRFALGRLVVTTPNPIAADVERTLNDLRARVAWYGTHLPASWARQNSLAAL